ncbi:MAG: hypothetical protein IT294_09455 [Deltaproteobacteria bacterium]|nr:hypothetical protein [Deltaproteobacteria bacterium]
MPRAVTSGRSAAGTAGLVGRARVEAGALVRDAQRVGARVQKRAEKLVADLERRAEKVVNGLETRAVKALAPALKRGFATRRELNEMRTAVRKLVERVDDLARKIG